MSCLGLPCHPILVHLPLGIAFCLPLLFALAWLWRGANEERRGLWTLALVLLGLGAIGAGLAIWSGEAERARVESIAPAEALERHVEAAWTTLFAFCTLLVLALLARRASWQRLLQPAVVLGSLLCLIVALRSGASGGALVFQHGVHRAYSRSDSGAAPGEGGTHNSSSSTNRVRARDSSAAPP